MENRYSMPRRLLSVRETAEILGLSPRTLHNRTGPKSPNPFPIQPKRVGRLLKFDIGDVARYLESL